MELLTQTNSKWSDYKLGSTQYTIGGSGCLLTSLCNAYNLHYQCEVCDPAWMGKSLFIRGGIQDNGFIVWAVVESVLNCKVDCFYTGYITSNDMEHYIVKFTNNAGQSHFSNLIGHCGQLYIIFDVFSGQTIIKHYGDVDRVIRLTFKTAAGTTNANNFNF